MERIKLYVEDLIGFMGLEGDALTMVRLLLMVLVAVVLAWLAYAFFHRLVMPGALQPPGAYLGLSDSAGHRGLATTAFGVL